MLNNNERHEYRKALSAKGFKRFALFIFGLSFLYYISSSVWSVGWTLAAVGPMRIFSSLVGSLLLSTMILMPLGVYNVLRIRYNRQFINQIQLKKQDEVIALIRECMMLIRDKVSHHSTVPENLRNVDKLQQVKAILEWDDVKGQKSEKEVLDWFSIKEEKKTHRVMVKKKKQSRHLK